MHFQALENISNRLAEDEDLNAYWAEEFPGVEVFHGIGLKPDEDNATAIPVDCFPYIAVFPLQETITENSIKVEENVGIMYGVNNDDRDGRVFVGLRQISALGLLILNALKKKPIGTNPAISWTGKAQIRSDAGITHPYYEGEIIIPVQVRL